MAVSGRTSPCHETNKSSRLDRERSEPGERFTEPLIVLTRRQFEQHATPSRCHHPRLAYPQIQKALETQHRSIAKLKQIQHPCMKTTMNLDDGLVREAMAIYRGKTKTAVVELGLQELINADRRRRLGEAFGSQPDLRTVARRRSAPDPR